MCLGDPIKVNKSNSGNLLLTKTALIAPTRN